MKIILSRKGFDSASGRCPSPIMPDGTLLSLPIPSGDAVQYRDLRYGNHGYDLLLQGLKPRVDFGGCHVDPDIRDGIRAAPVRGWKPAFGQAGSALGVLRNAGVGIGDLFLFFGLFRQAELWGDSIRFVWGSKPLHIVYGYLQIGKMLDAPGDMAAYPWHPHASGEGYGRGKNTLYVPRETLSLCPSLPGHGVLPLRADRVLTKRGANAATWEERSFLMPGSIIGNRKNCAQQGGVYYAGQWQELVLQPCPEAERWALGLIGAE